MCQQYNNYFYSNNKFYKHIQNRHNCKYNKFVKNQIFLFVKNVVNFYANINNLFVIRSTIFIRLKLFDYVF